ncbi:MAG TPA: porin family protein [Microvirga sp.]|jgi:opacity protein-like surface antigen|nr:porin family protein [Microvirga sp.]
MLSRTGVALVATLIAAAAPASAADLPPRQAPAAPLLAPQPVGGLYFMSRTGIGSVDDTSFALGGGSVGVRNEYEAGTTSFVALGYSFGPVLGGLTPRVEVEGMYGTFSIDTHTVNGTQVPSIDSFGDLRSLGAFGSAYLDFNLGTLFGSGLSAITPFVGGGIGFAQVELRKQGISATGVVIDDEDAQVAYHLSAGVGISLSGLGFGNALFDRTTLELGYRHLQVQDLEFTARDGTTSETDVTKNLFTVGVRRQF